jgi:hypothetical protein
MGSIWILARATSLPNLDPVNLSERANTENERAPGKILHPPPALDPGLGGHAGVRPVYFFPCAAHFLAKAGLPAWIRPVLGGAEIIAAILFLVPLTSAIDGCLLLVIFGLAALVHVLHGQYGIEGLVLYAVAVPVCMAYMQNRTVGATHERI